MEDEEKNIELSETGASEIPEVIEEKPKRKKRKHHRRVGRPRKPGPKKKRKSRAKKKPRKYHSGFPKIDYKIVACHNGKQDYVVGWYEKAIQAYDKLRELMEESEQVVFPKVSEVTTKGMKPAVYEYLVMEKNRDGSKKDAALRNEFGELVQQETNIDDYVIMDKKQYNKEEAFWIFGRNPRGRSRKTFNWIYDNIVTDGMDREFPLRMITLYRNKIYIKDDENRKDLIICKCERDAILFYEILEKRLKGDKRYMMMGYVGKRHGQGDIQKKVESEIAELTGWDIEKVQLPTTRKYANGKRSGKNIDEL